MTPLSRWIDKEWLLTNGLGSYMSTTPLGLNTRRYHGLFVAALRPPVGRHLLLSHCDEQIFTGQAWWYLSSNEYPDVIYPDGHRWLVDFTADPLPVATYECEGIRIQKQWVMPHEQQIAQINYRVERSPHGSPVQLEIRPLVAGRDYHHLLRESHRHVSWIDPAERSVALLFAGDIPLHLIASGGRFTAAPDWYRNFRYRVDAERGQDCEEDLFCPGVFSVGLAQGESITLTASLEQIRPPDFEESVQEELDRRRKLIPAGWEGASARLAVAADAFIVRRGETGYTILAGYPWFTDWGRDTMIALPGLTLVTGRYPVAKRILKTFASYCDEGMLPNRFPDSGQEPEYNTVDGTLWFFWALHKYLAYTDDWAFIHQIWPTLVSIIDWHVRGTRYGIRMDEDGLLLAGDGGTQLTWMDVRIGDWSVTPRYGKPVEVNALWYNALRICQRFAGRIGDQEQADRFARLANRVQQNFEATFWDEEEGILYDVVNDRGADRSVRPNQLLAVSLPFPLLSRRQAERVMGRVERELWTPMGLRSLSPRDPAYVGRYEGDSVARDKAYHQGTVWAWLIGPFISAMFAYERRESVRLRGRELVSGLIEHLDEAGLGFVSEIADGDPPHTPRGCFAQAWSVAELLRILREDLASCNGSLG